MQVRGGEGVEAKDGIDTLIVLLLADLDRAAELEHFCGGPTSTAVDQVEGPLRNWQRFLPLAALHAGAGHSSKALSIWQVIYQSPALNLPLAALHAGAGHTSKALSVWQVMDQSWALHLLQSTVEESYDQQGSEAPASCHKINERWLRELDINQPEPSQAACLSPVEGLEESSSSDEWKPGLAGRGDRPSCQGWCLVARPGCARS